LRPGNVPSADGWDGMLKLVVARYRRSVSRAYLRANAVRIELHTLAYTLGNFLRTLATPELIKDWLMTSLNEKLIKIGAKVVSHGRYRRVSNGRGRHLPAFVRRHPAADRGTASSP
jgi:hypothetical protein